MASLMPTGKQQYFDPSTGGPLAGGKLFTYVGGTSTPKDTWQDAGATIKNQNPIPLDTTGSAMVFWSGNYKVQLQDALGNVIYTVDNYSTDSRDHPVQVELQTASAGQTVFTLAQTTYTPGINSLHVYVDGLRVIMPDYTETSSTVVTFANPLATGQLVMFECGSAANSQSTLDASLIPYTPGGGATTNVAAALNGKANNADLPVYSVKQAGAKGDGVTDDTAAIQAALNSGARKIIFNAGSTFLTSGNQVSSNTHLVFERGAVLLLANGANRPALQNTNFQKSGWSGAPYGIDSNITIEGLYLDGNQANQAHTGSGVYAGEYTSGIRFGGVTNLILKDITIHYARTFGIWCYSIYNLTARDIRFDQYMSGTPDNQDGLHINGPSCYLDIRNIRGSTNDDMIALNADDGALGSNVTSGAITNAIIDGVYPVNCLNGIRLLSASSRMDQIVVKNVVGSTRDVAVNQSPFGLGSGNVGTLTIENIDVRCSNGYSGGNYYAYITLDGIIENVSIRNVRRNKAADNRPSVLLTSGANIGVCDIDGIYAVNVAGSVPLHEQLVTVNGLVDTLVMRNIVWFRDGTLTADGGVLWVNAASSAGATNVICSDWVVERGGDVISLTSGLLANIQLNNINDYNGLAGYSLLNLGSTTGATTNVLVANCRTNPGRKIVTKTASSVIGTQSITNACGVSGAQGALSGNQSITTGAYRKLALASAVYDRLGELDTTNNRFTNTQGDGEYLVTYQIQMTIPTNPTDITLALYVNGTVSKYLPGSQRYFTDAILGGQTIMQLAAGQYVEVFVNVNNATTAVAGGSTYVTIERLK